MVHKNVFLFLFLFGFVRLTNAETIRYYMFDFDDILKLLPKVNVVPPKAVVLKAKPVPLHEKPMQVNTPIDPRAKDNSPEIDTIMYDYDYDSYFRKNKPIEVKASTLHASSFEYQDCISKFPLRYCTEEIDFISHRTDPYPDKGIELEETQAKPKKKKPETVECKEKEDQKDLCKVKDPCIEKKPVTDKCKEIKAESAECKEIKTETEEVECKVEKKPSIDECKVNNLGENKKQPQNNDCKPQTDKAKPNSDECKVTITDECKEVKPKVDKCKGNNCKVKKPEKDRCEQKPEPVDCMDKTFRLRKKIIGSSHRKFSTDYVDVNDLMRAKEHKKDLYKQMAPDEGVTVKVIKGKNLINRIERALETAKGDTDFLEKIVSMFVPSASSQTYNLRRGPNSDESDSSSSESIELRPATFDKKKPAQKKKKLKLRPAKGSVPDKINAEVVGLAVPMPSAPLEASEMPAAQNVPAPQKSKIHKQKHDMKKKLKRFQVVSSLKNILNNMASDESLSQENLINDVDFSKETSMLENDAAEEASGDISVPLSEEITTAKPKLSKVPPHRKPATYMQGLKRIYKEGKDFRKRLETFLPKRYFWAPSEFKHLGYFWFNGPQGYHPGIWKVVT